MSIAQVASQIIIIFALMLVGALARECKFLSAQSVSDLTNVVLYFLSPMVILHAFQQPFSLAKFQVFTLLVVGIFIGYAATILIAHLSFHRVKGQGFKSILLYGSIYSNNGFMGIPLAQALFGQTGVFYGVASMIGFNVMSWTHGVSLFHGQANRVTHWQRFRQIILNPNIIAIIAGLIIFVASIHLPSLVTSFLTYGSQAFTPLSMMIIGSNLVGIKLRDVKLNGWMILALVFRNWLFPLVNLVILSLMGVGGTALITTVILAACPVAGLVVLFTLQSKGNTRPAVILMSVSTILSLVTIPAVYLCAQWLH